MAKVKSGFLTLFGLPNAGKSSLLNALVGEPLAIVTPKAQTTWQILRGHVVRPGLELVVTDTPGIQDGTKALNLALANNAARALKSASQGTELIAFVVDAAELGARLRDKRHLGLEPIGRVLKREFENLPLELPVIPVLNKADLLRKQEYRDQIEEVFLKFVREFFKNPTAPLWISTKKEKDTSELLEHIKSMLPEEESGSLFEEDSLSTQNMREFAAEFIREQCFLQLGAEIPYSIAIEITEFKENDPKLIRIESTLHVERESQKQVVIGKAGAKIKAIGTKARARLESFLGRKVYLGLKVKITPHWSREEKWVDRFGYGEKK